MSRTYDKVKVPGYMRNRLALVCCDLCGKELKFPHADCNWGNRFDVQEVSVFYKDGANYPEGGSGTTTSFDVCPGCFENKLVPWLAEQGATPIEEEWDW